MLGAALDVVYRGNGHRDENFATVLERGLGRTICRDFYFPYAEKIWGVAPTDLDAEQARRRVSANSIGKMVRKLLNAVPGAKKPGSGRFYYPRRGYGQISEAYFRGAIGRGASVRLSSRVREISRGADGAWLVTVENRDGSERFPAAQVLSTIPLPALVSLIRPSAPADITAAASGLRYRSMILVYLVLAGERFTEFDAHYFPGREVAITRLSEPKNYGLAASPGRTVLCAEVPCSVDDDLWRKNDADLAQLVEDALRAARLPLKHPVIEVATRRLAQAYPIYTRDYREHFEQIDRWVAGLDGVLTFGRQGLFAHDNTHHALAMAYAASDCLSDDGRLDRRRWAEHRRAFETHVVED
jgi:protoporphyrinogen oxidase